MTGSSKPFCLLNALIYALLARRPRTALAGDG